MSTYHDHLFIKTPKQIYSREIIKQLNYLWQDSPTYQVDLESTTKITAGHRYENECEAYGYDPTGEPFVIYKSIAMTAY